MKVLTKRRTSVLIGTNSSIPFVENVYKFLFFIFISLFLISNINAKDNIYSDCSIYGNCKVTSNAIGGNITYNYNNTNITNNYITTNATVNSTQFSNDNPITINTTWLDDFVNTWIGIFNSTLNFSSDLYVPYTGASKLIDLNNQNITNVNYINKVAFRNVTTMGNEIIWEIELDN